MTLLSAKKTPRVEKLTKLHEGLGGLGEASPVKTNVLWDFILPV